MPKTPPVRMSLKEARDALAVSEDTLRRLRNRGIFTKLPRENANGSTAAAKCGYLLSDEVYAYVTGGELAVSRLRTQERRI